MAAVSEHRTTETRIVGQERITAPPRGLLQRIKNDERNSLQSGSKFGQVRRQKFAGVPLIGCGGNIWRDKLNRSG
jgi:hypothetical protein